jgi:PilZ domain
MDQRREPRFEADQAVVVTILTEQPTRMTARVRNASGRGLGLFMSCRVDPGAAIRIEIDDAIVLGEAIYCRKESDGHFIGVELDQVLVGLTELGRRLSSFDPEVELRPLESPPAA